MSIKPILFNTEMVRANLDGRKSCTRRIVKGFIPNDAVWGYTAFTPKGYISCRGTFADGYGEKFFKLPCEPSDILYVRETWCLAERDTSWSAGFIQRGEQYLYKADDIGLANIDRWHPSIHMPKEAARIWLKVTDVRVERLQECGKDWCWDIVKEGIVTPKDPIFYINDKEFHEALRYEFKKLWNSTIKKTDLDSYGWDANPYVWVIEFERCEKPETL